MTTAMSGIRACVFDAYGTLLDFNDAVAQESTTLGNQASAFSELWRRKQLEYTWLRSLMQRHAPFWTVTGEALEYALDAFQLQDQALRERLMAAYLQLAPYPEVPAMLAQLKASGVTTAILSNGSPEMLADGVQAAAIRTHLDHLLSVEEVGIFKPAPAVYQLATERLAMPASAVAFMSSNCWDIHGAANFGFHCVWINRGNAPPDRLPKGPEMILKDLSSLPAIVGGTV